MCPDDPNPYRAAESVPADLRERGQGSSWRLIIGGALWPIALSFPIAAAMAVVYRFPVPFVGYQSGFEAVVPALFAVVMYGVIGGFFALGIAGAIGGVIVGMVPGTRRQKNLRLFFCSAALTTMGLFILAILDKIIGPW